MPVNDNDRQIVADLFKAMQAGPAGTEALLALFAEDGVLVESFTGHVQTHIGKPAIRAGLAEMGRNRAPDLSLKLERVDMDEDRIRAEWTCTASVLPSPIRGYDLFTIRSDKIARLEIIITEMPPMSR